MKKCSLCGSELPTNARFCGKCGSTQAPITVSEGETYARDSSHVDVQALEDPITLRIPRLSPYEKKGQGGVGLAVRTPAAEEQHIQLGPYRGPEDEETQPFRAILSNFPATSQRATQAPAPLPTIASAPTHAPSQAPVSRRTARKGLIIALTSIIIIAAVGAGIITYVLTNLQPAISVTSDYRLGSTLAASPGTVLHVSGQKFSSSSPITFLLDGKRLPGEQVVRSDTNGNIQADLTITDKWMSGRHILNMRDARGIAPKSGVTVAIVAPGQANTPGPHGAPPDDMSFRVNVGVQSHDTVTGQKFNLFTETLIITGRPDPAGGTVCSPFDDGKAHTLNGNSLNSGVTVRETVVLTCTGTYKSGKLSFTETAISYAIDFSNGVSCLVKTPYIYNQLQGTFTDQNSISGVYSAETPDLTCQQGFTGIGHAAKGTWTGQVETG